jgi:membrane protease YdiL (CAAX protease family)
MPDVPDSSEPPMVVRVEAEPSLVVPVAPGPKRPRPGLFEAVILTIGFAAVLFGTVFGVVGLALLVVLARGGANSLKPPEGAEPGSVGAIPQDLVGPLAWSFPAGYAAGLVFTLLVFRIVDGRGWVREAGLRRLPITPLLLGLLALPGFVVLSEALAGLLFRVFGMEQVGEEQTKALAGLFGSFHWSFAVLAVGIGPGLVEELWCRGFLGRGLVGRYGWAWGIAVTSLFFGMLHLWPPPYVLVTATMGVGLHYVYATSRSLWVPIAMHLLNNSFAVLLAVGTIPGSRIEAASNERGVWLVLVAVALVATAGLALWSARGRVVLAAPTDLHRGIMVPPPANGRIEHAPPSVLWTVLAVGFCAGLFALILI